MNRNGTARENGASMVEFAVVIPVFLLMLFGIIEMGMAFRNRLVIDDAVQASARVGSSAGNGIDSDLAMLETIGRDVVRLSNNGVGTLAYVEIYDVNFDGTQNLAETNRYFFTYTSDTTCDWTPCPDGTGGYNSWTWRPDERSVTSGSLDSIGVKAFFAHRWMTGMLPIDDSPCDTPAGKPLNCWTEDTVLRLEPLVFDVGS